MRGRDPETGDFLDESRSQKRREAPAGGGGTVQRVYKIVSPYTADRKSVV